MDEPKKNDILGHRLGLTVACLFELAEHCRAGLPQQIARKILDHWWNEQDRYYRSIPHIEQRLVSQAVCTLSKTALARRYLAMMSSALAVQTNGLG